MKTSMTLWLPQTIHSPHNTTPHHTTPHNTNASAKVFTSCSTSPQLPAEPKTQSCTTTVKTERSRKGDRDRARGTDRRTISQSERQWYKKSVNHDNSFYYLLILINTITEHERPTLMVSLMKCKLRFCKYTKIIYLLHWKSHIIQFINAPQMDS